MELNKIICGDCLEKMKEIPDKSMDMVLTSPPYDNLRDYEGYTFNFEGIAKEIYRVLKDSGVCVWIVGDATVKGSETGTSFKQALYFKEIGFNLHDTMIWEKQTFTATGALKTRYAQVFEYMFIFTKGKIKTFNPIKDRPTKGIRKKHYNLNRRYYIDKAKFNRDKVVAKTRKFILGYLKTHPCVDCGENRVLCLCFDHVRGEKSFNISCAVRNGISLNTIKNEIKKCDVRCMNCHTVKTAKQLNFWKIIC